MNTSTKVRQRIDLADVRTTAAAIVDADGVAALSLGTVATALGVQPSALYNHVDGIRGLWHELALHGTERLADDLFHAAVARSDAAALRAVAGAYRSFAQRHPGQFASLLLPPVSSEDALHASHARTIDVFVRVVESFGVDGDARIHTARIVRSAIHGFVALESISGMPSPQERDDSFTALIDFLIAGIGR